MTQPTAAIDDMDVRPGGKRDNIDSYDSAPRSKRPRYVLYAW